jgi:hypothetical protein
MFHLIYATLALKYFVFSIRYLHFLKAFVTLNFFDLDWNSTVLACCSLRNWVTFLSAEKALEVFRSMKKEKTLALFASLILSTCSSN